MSPAGTVHPPPTSVDGRGHCSFAVEYNGPPVAFRIPQAVPINVDKLPVATVVSQFSPPSGSLGFPVVQPIFSSEMVKCSKDVVIEGCEGVVSSSDIVPFVQCCEIDRDKVAISSVDGAVSPTSVIAFDEDGAGRHDYSVSGDLSVSDALEPFDFHGECTVLSSTCDGTTSTSLNNSFEWVGKASSSLNSFYFDGSQSSGAIGVSDEIKGNHGTGDAGFPECSSSGSARSLNCPSSSVSSFKLDDFNDETEPIPSVDCNVGIWKYDVAGSATRQSMKGADHRQKKGSCYRCFRGNRFTEKEMCIVCDAKYCAGCVLRSMGSMPEGRKCVTCIGSPIDELKRGMLGKHPRVLKKLLDRLEVRQIMKAEKFGEVNQLRPECIFVNKKPLSQEEILLLQSCPNPPKRLKPGGYWYDKVSGLWGKEGKKPYQVISPYLNVGGIIEPNASNGNTEVFINGREITKIELRMLQLSGVQCAGNPHFWVNEDGSYQEEGQKNTKGYIWGKPGSKLICTFLSLPMPSKSSIAPLEYANHAANRIVPDYFEQKMIQKFLLVGNNGSGTSTIFKQAKFLYKSPPFSDDELDCMKLKIQINVYSYLGILLDGREHFEDERLKEITEIHQSNSPPITDIADRNAQKNEYSIGPRLKSFADWILKNMASESLKIIFPTSIREYAPLVEELWNDAAIKATYNRRFELLMLPKHSYYFLERAVEILKTDYEPSNMDILRAEGVTASSGLSCVEFTFPVSGSGVNNNGIDQLDCLLRYQLIRLQSRRRGDKWKVLEMFEDVRMIIFCVSAEEYDEFSKDGEDDVTTNKMMSNKACFESLVAHPSLSHLDFLLLLTKFDVLDAKVYRSPLSTCPWFADFQPVSSQNQGPAAVTAAATITASSNFINYTPSLGQLAFHYMAAKFKRLYASLTGRKLYVSMVAGLEAESVDAALRLAGEMVKWEEEKLNFCPCDDDSFFD